MQKDYGTRILVLYIAFMAVITLGMVVMHWIDKAYAQCPAVAVPAVAAPSIHREASGDYQSPWV
jgi:hypothetical protein